MDLFGETDGASISNVGILNGKILAIIVRLEMDSSLAAHSIQRLLAAMLRAK